MSLETLAAVAPVVPPALVLTGPWGRAGIAAVGAVLPSHGITHAGHVLRPGDRAEFDPVALLGRKGTRYKDRATLLGVAAAAQALDDGAVDTSTPRSDIGLLVTSCYGNLSAVCENAELIDREGVSSLSPLALPNASSNVVATEISIRRKLQGVVLTLCNGHASGWAALRWAMALLASGRSTSVLVVAVEAPSPHEQQLRGAAPPLVEGAVAVLLTGTGTPAGDSPGSVAGHSAGRGTQLPGHELASVQGLLAVASAAALTRETGSAVTCGGAPGEGTWTVLP